MPYALGEQQVAAAVFDATAPQTLSATFTFTVGANGEDVVAVESTRSITFQRVRADGSPL